MAVVLSASITLAWAFHEVQPAVSETRERLRHGEALVSSLGWFGARNGLVMGERRKLPTE